LRILQKLGREIDPGKYLHARHRTLSFTLKLLFFLQALARNENIASFIINFSPSIIAGYSEIHY